MRRMCAIQQAIYLLNEMFRWIKLLAITGQRCNDEFIVNNAIFLVFLTLILRVDRRKKGAKLVIKP